MIAALRTIAIVVALVALAPACGSDDGGDTSTSAAASDSEGSADVGSGTASGSSDSTGPIVDDAWLQLGTGHIDYAPLIDGGEIALVIGTQGAWMLPISVRAGGFPLPADPTNVFDPDIPTFDVAIDVDGHNDDPLGHFVSEIGRRMTFDTLDDGTYEYVSVWLILPDGKSPTEVVGLPCQLTGTLYLADGRTLTESLNLTITGGPK